MDLIVVRDRRQARQFSIANEVMDQWLPIIGTAGYAIYSLYVRMANADDERCWPGYTLISTHLGLGKTTVSRYNRLLCWCRLIHIEEGDRYNSNNYYILDVPEVDLDALHYIEQHAREMLDEDDPFLKTILKRLESWEPIQTLWASPARAVETVRPGQMALPGCEPQAGSPVVEQGVPPQDYPSPPVEQGVPPQDYPSPPVEQGVPPQDCNNPNQQSKPTIQKDNPKQQQEATGDPWSSVVGLLSSYGVVMSSCPDLTECNYDLARAWCLYTDTQDLVSPAGFVISKLRARAPPAHDFYILAGIKREAWTWLEKHVRRRGYSGQWPVELPVPEDTAELWFEYFGGA